MKHIKKRKIFIPIVMASLITTLGVGTFGLEASRAQAATSSSISATTANTNTTGNKHGFGKGKGQGASGTVTAISGSILTITGKNNVVYAVDASTATLLKASHLVSQNGTVAPGIPTAIALSDIKVGDTIMVRGTINGDSIKATKIVDGNQILKSKVAMRSNKNLKNANKIILKK